MEKSRGFCEISCLFFNILPLRYVVCRGGVLSLTGAKAALGGTPGMIGYGLAKAAVHQLVKSLASADSGLPKGSKVNAVAPITLDTPANRGGMPNADFSSWTPLETLAQ